MLYPAQLTSCQNVNYVADSCYLPKLFFLTQEKLSKLHEIITVVMVMVKDQQMFQYGVIEGKDVVIAS